MPGGLSGCPQVTALSHLIIKSIRATSGLCGNKWSLCTVTTTHLFTTGYSHLHKFKNAFHVLLPIKLILFLSAVLLNCSQTPDKLFFLFFSHIHSLSPEPGIFYVRYMVSTAFPTRANVKQTLTNLPVNSSHHQNRGKGVSLAQLG